MFQTLVSCVILLFIYFLFWIISHLQYKKVIKNSKQQVEVVNINMRALGLRKKFYQAIRENKFQNIPYIKKYISDCIKLFVKEDYLDWENIRPVKNKRSNVFFERMVQEIKIASDECKELLLEAICIVDDIARIKRPIFYKYVGFKKNTSIRILDVLIFLCKILIFILDKMKTISNTTKKQLSKSKILSNHAKNALSFITCLVNEDEYMKQVNDVRTVLR